MTAKGGCGDPDWATADNGAINVAVLSVRTEVNILKMDVQLKAVTMNPAKYEVAVHI
jgi:hypothetical protein